jgi:lysozyme
MRRRQRRAGRMIDVSRAGQAATRVWRARWRPSWGRPRRRTLVAVGALAVLTGIVAALIWYQGLPRYRPGLRPGERHGVDVSAHQGEIRWDRVAADGMSFAYIKATEGAGFVDRRFAANWSGASSVGLDRGAYHFFTLCAPGAAQARNFLTVVPTDPGALPPAVDLEFGTCERRPGRAEFERELRVFVDTVEERVGKRVVLYVMPDFAERYPAVGVLDRARWERSPFRRPDGGWAIWQASGVARVDGVHGRVDLDVARAGAVGGG